MTTTHAQIVKALEDLGAKEWTLTGDDIDAIVWITDDKKTKAQIETAIANPLPVKKPTIMEKLAQLGLTAEEVALIVK